VEGKLVAPWVDEFTAACERAKADLHGRELLLDLRNVSAINQEAENALLHLIREKVKLQCGLFMKEVLRQRARKSQRRQEASGADSG
jgi:hypothetical protein